MENSTVVGVRLIPIHNGKCLFHLRDDKPTISHPNKWSFISGGIEEGETFEETVRRESQEEIGINPENLHYLGYSGESAAFYAYLTDEEAQNLVLGEGQEIRFFDPREMSDLSKSPKLEELVTVYVDSLEKLIRKEPVIPEDFGLTA